MHHGEDSLTLSNPGAVSLLNQRMKDMGYSTRFKAGDRIRVNFDEQGNIESAFAVRGASRESSDITSEIKGYESNYLNVSRQTTGFRGEHGFMDTSFNYKRTIGTGLVEMGKDAAGKPIYGAGFREAYFDRKTGELAAETWTNKRTGQFTGVEYIPTGRKDPETGKPIKAPQWVTGTMELDKGGSYVVKDFRSISNQEVVRGDGKFVSEMKVDAGSGLRLYEVGRGGQDMARVNKLVLDEQSEARFTIGGGFLADDKSQVTASQESVLWVAAGLEKGAECIARLGTRVDAFLGPKREPEAVGGSPTSKDMEEFDKYFRRMNRSTESESGPQCRKLRSNAAVAGATEGHSEAQVGRNKISGLDSANKGDRMELVHNCLKVQGGIIVPVYNVEPEAMKRLSGSSILISVKSYGIEVRIDEIVVPIPEFMLEFVIDNNTITFYRADNAEYLWEPLLSVEIPRDDLIEARGAYKFIQSSNSGENKEMETAAQT